MPHTVTTVEIDRPGLPQALAGTLFAPTDTAPHSLLLINGAMGVRQHLYHRLAAWLAGKGLAVLTYDYRDLDARPAALRRSAVCIEDWAADMAGLIDWLEARFPGRPCWALGHSLGGQIVGACPAVERLSGLLFVASGTAYWRHWRGMARAQMWLYFHVFIPGITRLVGYFPGRALRAMENLPPGVARQWATWARSPDYLFDHLPAARATYGALRLPWLALAFADDSYAPRGAVEALLRHYGGAPRTILAIAPSDWGMSAIGHFGFFRRGAEATAWPAFWQAWQALPGAPTPLPD